MNDRIPVRIIQTTQRNGEWSRLQRLDTGEDINHVLIGDWNPGWPWPAGTIADAIVLDIPASNEGGKLVTESLPVAVVEWVETRPERLLPAAVDVDTRHRRGVCLVHGVLRSECVATIEAAYELQRRSA